MRSFLPLSLLALTLLALSPTNSSAAPWESSYDKLLQKYVVKTGVRYAAWQANKTDRRVLDAIVSKIAEADLTGLSRDEKLAFYLNAYNAWILKTMLDHYPVKSIKDTMYFVFRRDIITVAGKKTNFHALENQVIRKQFKESRIHFALNCASASCPPLHHRAFTAKSLDETLTKLTKEFITNNSLGLRWQKGAGKVHVSKIFDWYKDDFKREAGSIMAYLVKYRGTPFPANTKLKFQDYDWSINEAK